MIMNPEARERLRKCAEAMNRAPESNEIIEEFMRKMVRLIGDLEEELKPLIEDDNMIESIVLAGIITPFALSYIKGRDLSKKQWVEMMEVYWDNTRFDVTLDELTGGGRSS